MQYVAADPVSRLAPGGVSRALASRVTTVRASRPNWTFYSLDASEFDGQQSEI